MIKTMTYNLLLNKGLLLTISNLKSSEQVSVNPKLISLLLFTSSVTCSTFFANRILSLFRKQMKILLSTTNPPIENL